MPATTWVLCDEDGTPITEVVNAASRTFNATRNTGRQGTLTLAHADKEARDLLDVLRNGVPQLRYYRESEGGDMGLWLSAYLTSLNESLSTDGEDFLVAVFKDPFRRIYGGGSGGDPGRILLAPVSYTAEDQGAIAWALIDALNTDSDTGLRQGTIATTTPRDRQYEAGKNVGEAVTQLTEVIGGFDFDVLPLDPTENAGKLGEFTVYASQGVDREDVIWGYGAGTFSNVLSVRRQITPPINRVYMTTADGLASIRTAAPSLTTFGEWAVGRSAPNDVTEQATLDAQAAEALRPGWVKVTTFKPDPDARPLPGDHYWLGDTGRFRAIEGAFMESFTPRVNSITITEDEEGSEDHELEVVAV